MRRLLRDLTHNSSLPRQRGESVNYNHVSGVLEALVSRPERRKRPFPSHLTARNLLH